jgi:hypothetical protein
MLLPISIEADIKVDSNVSITADPLTAPGCPTTDPEIHAIVDYLGNISSHQ